MRPGEKYKEKSYDGQIRILKIKLIKYLGQDRWEIHCRSDMDGNIKYYYSEITGEDIMEYYDKIEEA